MQNTLSKPEELIQLIGTDSEKRIYLSFQKNKKLRYYDGNEKKELAQKVLQWCHFIGVNEAPSTETLFVLVKYLCNNYPTISSAEISLAFELAMSNKIEVDANHYGKFDALYISRILNAYLDRREQVIYLFNKKKKEIEFNNGKIEKTLEEKISDKISLVQFALERMQTTGDFIDYGNAVFKIVYNARIMEVTLEKQLEYIEAAKEMAMQELDKNYKENPLERIKIKEKIEQLKSSEDPYVIVYSKQLALKDFLKDCLVKNVDIVSKLKAKFEEIIKTQKNDSNEK